VPRDLLRGGLAIGAALGLGVAVAVSQGVSAVSPTLRELVGQRLVVAMAGTAPSPSLLGRIRRGEVGGVILFGGNVRSPAQVRALTASLHRAAERAGRPTLLVVVDQEGGDLRRLRWAPPARSAEQMGRRSPASTRAAGRATGEALHSAGIDVDLAPVADVPRIPGSFLAAQGRAFSTDPRRVSSHAAAFARGLADAGVLAAAKHFPGLGGAGGNTDLAPVSIGGTPSELAADLDPFRSAVAAGVPLVMLSSAVYPSYGREPALWTPAVHRLLRRELGFAGATVSDALEAVAATRQRPLDSVAVLAARAGTDLLLLAGAERTTSGVFGALVAAARDGRLPRVGLERSYRRVVALKEALPGP
jgi:beta-N-acetylhexosaminidase